MRFTSEPMADLLNVCRNNPSEIVGSAYSSGYMTS